jgi:hypothetical protein
MIKNVDRDRLLLSRPDGSARHQVYDMYSWTYFLIPPPPIGPLPAAVDQLNPRRQVSHEGFLLGVALIL